MRPWALSVVVITPLLAIGLPFTSAYAFDLTGAWASNPKFCAAIFERKGDTVSFRRESETHGSGFIVDGNTIRG